MDVIGHFRGKGRGTQLLTTSRWRNVLNGGDTLVHNSLCSETWSLGATSCFYLSHAGELLHLKMSRFRVIHWWSSQEESTGFWTRGNTALSFVLAFYRPWSAFCTPDGDLSFLPCMRPVRVLQSGAEIYMDHGWFSRRKLAWFLCRILEEGPSLTFFSLSVFWKGWYHVRWLLWSNFSAIKVSGKSRHRRVSGVTIVQERNRRAKTHSLRQECN